MELIQQALDRGILLCINKFLVASTVVTSSVYWPLIEAVTQLERQIITTTSPVVLKVNVKDIIEYLKANKADMRFIYGENNTLNSEAANLKIDLTSTEKGIEQYILMACSNNFLTLYAHPQNPQVSLVKKPLFPVTSNKEKIQELIDLTTMQEEESEEEIETLNKEDQQGQGNETASKKRRRRRKKSKKAINDVLDHILEIY